MLENGKIRVSEKELDRLDKISDEEGNVLRLEYIAVLVLDRPSKYVPHIPSFSLPSLKDLYLLVFVDFVFCE